MLGRTHASMVPLFEPRRLRFVDSGQGEVMSPSVPRPASHRPNKVVQDVRSVYKNYYIL